MRLPLRCRLPVFAISRPRAFVSSALLHVEKRQPKWLLHQPDRLNTDFEEEFEDDEYDQEGVSSDTTAAGHLVLQQQRELLHYMRLIEHEMPKLVAFRRPFNPSSLDVTPVAIRSISYGGEEHPATSKRTIVVPVAKLPLKNDVAVHNIKLLAGVRWTAEPPQDSGIAVSENAGQHGYIKISCEQFPKVAQNLKWASDALDRLIDEANKNMRFAEVPLDTRYLEAKARKSTKGGRGTKKGRPPSIKDFPEEWLPPSKPQIVSTA